MYACMYMPQSMCSGQKTTYKIWFSPTNSTHEAGWQVPFLPECLEVIPKGHLFYVYDCSACIHVSVLCVYLAPMKAPDPLELVWGMVGAGNGTLVLRCVACLLATKPSLQRHAFESWSHVTWAGFELTMYLRLALNFQSSLSLLSVGIAGVHRHTGLLGYLRV